MGRMGRMNFRTIGLLAIAACLVAGCSSTTGKGVNGSSAPSGTAAPCTKATAQSAPKTYIGNSGFSPSCVKIASKSLFSFVNDEGKDHSADTQPGSPASFVADLPKRTSTYSRVFKEKGTYVIVDKATGKTMTLYVV